MCGNNQTYDETLIDKKIVHLKCIKALPNISLQPELLRVFEEERCISVSVGDDEFTPNRSRVNRMFCQKLSYFLIFF